MSLVAFNSAAHNKPSLIADLLDSILPNLYNETKVKVRNLLLKIVHLSPSFPPSLSFPPIALTERVNQTG